MNVLEKRDGRLRTAQSLPNYTTAGSYCFFSECIFLDKLEEKDYLAITDGSKTIDSQYEQLKKFLPLLNHEVKHWYDAHSTLWGLKLIKEIYVCRGEYNALQKGGINASVDQFDKQVALKDSIDYIKFPQYYSTTNIAINSDGPWKYNYSAGRIFSKYGNETDRPIFFTRFDNKINESIARVPFSLCALLESSAVSQELTIKAELVSGILDPVSKKLEQNKFKAETIAELYDANIVEYSVVAHKVANSFNLSDAMEAYNIAATITRLILNLTDDVIDLLIPQKLLSEQFKPFIPSYLSALKYRDKGAIFSLIIDSLYSQFQLKGKKINGSNVSNYIEELLVSHVGLSLDQVARKTLDAITQLSSETAITQDAAYLDGVLVHGKELFAKFGLLGSPYIDLSQEFIPDIILGDNTFFSQQGNTVEFFEKRYYELSDYRLQLDEISSACIA